MSLRACSAAEVLSIRPADPCRDNTALGALARRCARGGRLSFYHDFDDYRERVRLYDGAEVMVAEHHGDVVAAAALGRKAVWLGGARRPAGHVSDVMVDPEYRGHGLAKRLLRQLRQASSEAEIFSCYVLESDLIGRRLLESAGFSAYSHRLLYHLVAPRGGRREPPSGFHHCDSGRNSVATAFEGGLRRGYDFLDAVERHDGVFDLDWRGTRARAALRRHEARVFVDLPWSHRVLGRFLGVVPRLGRRFQAWSLHYLMTEGSEPSSALEQLIESVACIASREGVDALYVPLFENDPRTAQVRRCTLAAWGLRPVAATLYVAGVLAKAVLRSSRPFLMSSRDC